MLCQHDGHGLNGRRLNKCGYNGRDKSGPYPTRNRVPSGYELRDGHDMIYSINIVETGDVFCPFYSQWRVVRI